MFKICQLMKSDFVFTDHIYVVLITMVYSTPIVKVQISIS